MDKRNKQNGAVHGFDDPPGKRRSPERGDHDIRLHFQKRKGNSENIERITDQRIIESLETRSLAITKMRDHFGVYLAQNGHCQVVMLVEFRNC